MIFSLSIGSCCLFNLKKIVIFAAQNNRMKRLVVSSLTVMLLVGCAGDSTKELKVTGQVKGLKKGTLYLQQIQDTTLVTLDSTAVGEQGNFELNGNVEGADLYYVYLNKADNNNVNDRIVFFTAPGEISIQTRWNAFDSDAEISGSELQEKYQEYRKNQSRFHVQELEIAKEMAALNLPDEQVKMDSLENVLNRITLRSYLYAINVALNNRDSELGPFIAYSEVADANPKYLDSVYRSLRPEIAASRYGKKLKSLLENKKD